MKSPSRKAYMYLQSPQSDVGCAGAARARRRGHLAKFARPWRCAAARGEAISRHALGARRTWIYLTWSRAGGRKEFLSMRI